MTAPGKRDSPKLGTGCGIAIKKESGMRDFHKKGAGMRDQDPPFQTLLLESGRDSKLRTPALLTTRGGKVGVVVVLKSGILSEFSSVKTDWNC